MAITGFDHVVLLVEDLDEGIRTWRDQLGIPLSHKVELPDTGIAQAFFSLSDGTFIELVAPLGEDSPVTERLVNRGEGMHVLSLSVDDLDGTVASMERQGARLIGAGTPRVMVHPESSGGVLIQLWPKGRPHRWRDGEGR